MTDSRVSTIRRTTSETDVEVTLTLAGTGAGSVATGIGFLDHMLIALAKHGRLDLEVACRGDLRVDDHHTAEDCALAIGSALDAALGERRGIARFGYAYAPLDEALCRAVVDLSGRPSAFVDLALRRERIGDLASENVTHFFRSLATAARLTLHLDVIRGENDHHKAEAAFKAVALGVRQAVALEAGSGDVPSTKGSLA